MLADRVAEVLLDEFPQELFEGVRVGLGGDFDGDGPEDVLGEHAIVGLGLPHDPGDEVLGRELGELALVQLDEDHAVVVDLDLLGEELPLLDLLGLGEAVGGLLVEVGEDDLVEFVVVGVLRVELRVVLVDDFVEISNGEFLLPVLAEDEDSLEFDSLDEKRAGFGWGEPPASISL